jgi:Xaa-Pro aminopeptidase
MTPTALTSSKKLTQLRQAMAKAGVDWLWVPSVDAHLNEYLPDCWQRRAWLSGFTGSAGDALVGQHEAWLFVDSRYHTQADLEVDTACWHVSKLGLTDQKTALQFLEHQLGAQKRGVTLGFDPATVPLAQWHAWQKLTPKGLTLHPTHKNLIDPLWQADSPAQPPLPTSPVYGLADKVTGESTAKKLDRLQAWLVDQQLDAVVLTKLDQVAWLLNARGQDIPYNPVFLAYALITPVHAWLFTEPSRVATSLVKKWTGKVTVAPYDHLAQQLQQVTRDTRKATHRTTHRAKGGSHTARIALDPKHNTTWVHMLVSESGATAGEVVETTVPVELWKARKNQAELAGMRQANHQATVAITHTLDWLSAQMAAKRRVSEADLAEYLEGQYAAQPHYKGLSFNTIAGFGPHSAIVHYGTPDPQTFIKPGAFFLVDSGAQYLGGTTDCTRTVLFGKPTTKHQTIYTAVLQAHIDCASTVFPEGTTGAQLDAICRRALWQQGLDYGHGTGHGVGAFLNVHEGPNGIHKLATTPLEPGMITSIEPGYYQAGWGGVRLENLYEVIDTGQTLADGRKLFTFATLCTVRFESSLIKSTMLTAPQAAWLKAYQSAAFQAPGQAKSPKKTPKSSSKA